MEYILTLDRLKPGQAARITALLCGGDIRRRLQDIGMIPGTKVECLQLSPLCDPAAFLIRGAVIALRKDISRNILVKRADAAVTV